VERREEGVVDGARGVWIVAEAITITASEVYTEYVVDLYLSGEIR
jgi:hypothetical protein